MPVISRFDAILADSLQMTNLGSGAPNELWSIESGGHTCGPFDTAETYPDLNEALILHSDSEGLRHGGSPHEMEGIDGLSGLGYRHVLPGTTPHDSFSNPHDNGHGGQNATSSSRPRDEQILKQMAYTVRMEEDLISSQEHSKRVLEGELSRLFQSEARLREEYDFLTASVNELRQLWGTQERSEPTTFWLDLSLAWAHATATNEEGSIPLPYRHLPSTHTLLFSMNVKSPLSVSSVVYFRLLESALIPPALTAYTGLHSNTFTRCVPLRSPPTFPYEPTVLFHASLCDFYFGKLVSDELTQICIEDKLDRRMTFIETKKKMTGERQNGMANYAGRVFQEKPPEPDALEELLAKRSKELLAASSYWGATGEVPPREPDDATKDNLFRFKPEMNRKLMPLPREITSYPKTLDYSHVGFHHMTDDSNSDTGGLNKGQTEKLQDSGMGVGSDGKIKPRFLNLQTEYMRMPHKFDPAVLEEKDDGDRLERKYEKERDKIKKTPFDSANPGSYRLTSDDYCDMSGIDPSSYRVEGDWDEVSKLPPGERPYVYKSRWNNVNREGPKRREATHTMLHREHEVDPKQLREIMMKERQKHMPRGYQVPKTEWLSTTHREHAKYDVDRAAEANEPNNTSPVRNVNYALTPAHKEAVEYHDERARTKLDGDWGTEYGDNYQDRYDQAEINKDHAGKSVFDVEYGVYTMDHHFHHPRSDVNTGESYKPHELVPQQYVTMATEPLMAKNTVNLKMKRNSPHCMEGFQGPLKTGRAGAIDLLWSNLLDRRMMASLHVKPQNHTHLVFFFSTVLPIDVQKTPPLSPPPFSALSGEEMSYISATTAAARTIERERKNTPQIMTFPCGLFNALCGEQQWKNLQEPLLSTPSSFPSYCLWMLTGYIFPSLTPESLAGTEHNLKITTD
eukprot:gene8348-5847_t